MFSAPPAARPYSAEKPLATTTNSWMASWLKVVRVEPTDTSLLSRPSTMMLFTRGFWPRKESLEPAAAPPPLLVGLLSWATSGVVRLKLVKSRRLIGRFVIWFVSMVFDTCVRVGSTTLVCPSTSTVALASSACRSTRTSCVEARRTPMALMRLVEKPGASTVSV